MEEETCSSSLTKVLTIGVLLAPASALAVPITVDFTITNSSAYIGSDLQRATRSAARPMARSRSTTPSAPSKTQSAGSAAIDLSLNWLGASFDESNTQIWQLRFDSLGALTGWALGGANCAFNCINSAGPSDLYVTGGAPYNGTSAGHVEGVNGWMVGSVTSWNSHPASVPTGHARPARRQLVSRFRRASQARCLIFLSMLKAAPPGAVFISGNAKNRESRPGGPVEITGETSSYTRLIAPGSHDTYNLHCRCRRRIAASPD